MTDRAPIGTMDCENCGATVAVKLTVKGRAYYRCAGEIEDRACHRRVTMGPRETEALIQTFNAQLHESDDGQDPIEEDRRDDPPAPVEDDRPEPAGDPDPEPKPRERTPFIDPDAFDE